jgi:transposase-like protein
VVRKDVLKYSEAFKAQVVREIETGKLSSCWAASERYGIRGTMTVVRWVRKYGRNHLIGKVVRVETVGERDELKRLKQRVRELEGVVADQALDLAVERTYVKLACREAGIQDVEAFKKKVPGTVRTGR